MVFLALKTSFQKNSLKILDIDWPISSFDNLALPIFLQEHVKRPLVQFILFMGYFLKSSQPR